MVPISLYISLPYYLFTLLWSGIYLVFSNIKKGFKMLGDSYINYHIMPNEEFEYCENSYIDFNFS